QNEPIPSDHRQGEPKNQKSEYPGRASPDPAGSAAAQGPPAISFLPRSKERGDTAWRVSRLEGHARRYDRVRVLPIHLRRESLASGERGLSLERGPVERADVSELQGLLFRLSVPSSRARSPRPFFPARRLSFQRLFSRRLSLLVSPVVHQARAFESD